MDKELKWIVVVVGASVVACVFFMQSCTVKVNEEYTHRQQSVGTNAHKPYYPVDPASNL